MNPALMTRQIAALDGEIVVHTLVALLQSLPDHPVFPANAHKVLDVERLI
jgi:hypothetical protein